MKIKFDMKYRPQIESGEYKVETRDGRPVRVVCWDRKYGFPICGLATEADGHESYVSCYFDGIADRAYECPSDLFIVTPEPELSEFEKGYMRIVHKMNPEDFNDDGLKIAKEEAAELLDLARKEVVFVPKESEDEQMRKEMLDYFKDKKERLYHLCFECGDVRNAPFREAKQIDDFLAYLERQKEYIDDIRQYAYNKGLMDAEEKQKPLSTEETELNSIAFLEQLGYTCVPPGAEQKPAEWSEEDKGALEDAICATDILGNDESFNKSNPNLAKAFRVAKVWLKTLPERFNLQQKHEWSKEDEGLIDLAVAAVEDFYDKKNPIRVEIINFLHSLRPQPRRRDTYYDIVHDILDVLKDRDFTQITPEHRTSLLNDIRVKCKHADEWAGILDEPHWKPSEEQMKALLSKLPVVKGSGDKVQDILESLYSDLKNL